ncbi:hypothetical protein Q8F55_004703 [Vanrija albida]|uniref:Uncharacterized protein n=1 Tax=Vanrija albida TaxID=181172 RepID=A0ABR3Q7H9_9TREE
MGCTSSTPLKDEQLTAKAPPSSASPWDDWTLKDGMVVFNNPNDEIRRAAAVVMFESAFLRLLPGVVRSTWASYSALMPNATEVWIYAAIARQDGQGMAIRMLAAPGCGNHPASNPDPIDYCDPLVGLMQGIRGVENPSRVIIRYMPRHADGERVQVDMTWLPKLAGDTAEDVLDKVKPWVTAIKHADEDKAMYSVHSTSTSRSRTGDIHIAGDPATLSTSSSQHSPWLQAWIRGTEGQLKGDRAAAKIEMTTMPGGKATIRNPDERVLDAAAVGNGAGAVTFEGGIVTLHNVDEATRRASRVLAFEQAFGRTLPGLVRSIWGQFRSLVPDVMAIWIHAVAVDVDGIRKFVFLVRTAHGGSTPDNSGAIFDTYCDPLFDLLRGVRGVDHPSRVVIKYSPRGPDGERVDVVMTWMPEVAGDSLQYAAYNAFGWQGLIDRVGELEAMAFIHSTPTARETLGDIWMSGDPATYAVSSKFSPAMQSWTLGTEASIAWPAGPPATTERARFVIIIERLFLATLPAVLYAMFARFLTAVPEATAIWIYFAHIDDALVSTVIASDGGRNPQSLPDFSDCHKGYSMATEGVHGVDVPSRVVIKYMPKLPEGERVEVDMTWFSHLSGDSHQAAVSNMEQWRLAMQNRGEEEARLLIHSTPTSLSRTGDISVAGDPEKLATGDCQWSPSFKAYVAAGAAQAQ